MSQNLIYWNHIAAAVDYYHAEGYQYIEVPWYACEEAINVTLSVDVVPLRTQDGLLVGSAEQSFIHLLLNGTPLNGKYVAVTPCFRPDAIDKTHQRYFMKVELFDTCPGGLDSPQAITSKIIETARIARSFFHTLHPGDDCHLRGTYDGYDLELNGIEIGSYGYRSYGDWRWIYGTGYADPRFSIAKSLSRGRF